MPYKEKDTEKIYHTIGEVAALFNVNTSLIRFWEKEFDILKPKKNKKGNRLFTKQDLENLHIIFDLVKKQGYTLDGAKQKMSESVANVNENDEIYRKLIHLRNKLQDILRHL